VVTVDQLNGGAGAISEVTRQIRGYRIGGDEVVFDFRPADYEWATSDQDNTRTRLREVSIEKVCVVGDFNSWKKDQWMLQKVADPDHYELRRKMSEFTGKSQYQFKFFVNGHLWIEPSPDTANVVKVGGNILNLYLTLR
jgi:hypothetical protein